MQICSPLWPLCGPPQPQGSTHHCPVLSWSLVCPHHHSLPSSDSQWLITRVDSVKERTIERVSWPLCRHRPTYSLVCGAWRMRTCCYLQFSPGVELLQAVHGLLSMHAGGHGGPVLEEVGERSVSGRQAHPRSPHSQNILWMGWVSCEEQFSVLGDGINILARDI